MLTHPSVALAAPIGIPDETRGEAIKVLVKLRKGYAPTPALERELRQFVRSQLAPTSTRDTSRSSRSCRSW